MIQNPQHPTYRELIEIYGPAKFTAACAKAKFSPLSVEDILKLDADVERLAERIQRTNGPTAVEQLEGIADGMLTPEQRAHRAGVFTGAAIVGFVWLVTWAGIAFAIWPTLRR